MDPVPYRVPPDLLLACALLKEGAPYVWGRKGPNVFDCSGLVTWALHQCGGPDLRTTVNSQGLADLMEPVERMPAGEVLLAFYGFNWDHVEHVMFATPDGRAFGACGGGHTTSTVEKARDIGACVRFRPTLDYRPGRDLLGFRRLRYRPGVPTPGARAHA
jgi:murein DD-endopeptidase